MSNINIGFECNFCGPTTISVERDTSDSPVFCKKCNKPFDKTWGEIKKEGLQAAKKAGLDKI